MGPACTGEEKEVKGWHHRADGEVVFVDVLALEIRLLGANRRDALEGARDPLLLDLVQGVGFRV